MKLKYTYKIVDDETGELVYEGWSYSQESLLENLRKADHAVELYKERLKEQAEIDKAKDEDRLPEDNEISHEKIYG